MTDESVVASTGWRLGEEPLAVSLKRTNRPFAHTQRLYSVCVCVYHLCSCSYFVLFWRSPSLLYRQEISVKMRPLYLSLCHLTFTTSALFRNTSLILYISFCCLLQIVNDQANLYDLDHIRTPHHDCIMFTAHIRYIIQIKIVLSV